MKNTTSKTAGALALILFASTADASITRKDDKEAGSTSRWATSSASVDTGGFIPELGASSLTFLIETQPNEALKAAIIIQTLAFADRQCGGGPSLPFPRELQVDGRLVGAGKVHHYSVEAIVASEFHASLFGGVRKAVIDGPFTSIFASSVLSKKELRAIAGAKKSVGLKTCGGVWTMADKRTVKDYRKLAKHALSKLDPPIKARAKTRAKSKKVVWNGQRGIDRARRLQEVAGCIVKAYEAKPERKYKSVLKRCSGAIVDGKLFYDADYDD